MVQRETSGHAPTAIGLSGATRWLAALVVAGALSGCMMYAPGEPYDYVPKVSLALNTPAIDDPLVRSRAQAAQRDIEDTLLALGDGRLDRPAVQARIGWTASTPLQLPPEWRDGGAMKDRSGMKRAPMAFMKADDWASPDAETVAFTAVFRDGLKPELEVRERQTYRRVDARWVLVRQERLAGG